MCDDHDHDDFRVGAGADEPGGLTRRSLLKRASAMAAVLAAAPPVAVLRWSGAAQAQSQGPGAWYRVDTHAHSGLSSDSVADVGVLADQARLTGYHALFVTDHDGGSSFPISGQTALAKYFRDSFNGGWFAGSSGTASVAEMGLVTSPAPVIQGTSSLNIRVAAPAYAEQFQWSRRAPNFLNGAIRLTFKAFPQQVDAGCGAYVSLSLGGDPTTGFKADGYTTQNGTVQRTKRFLWVWAIGDVVHPGWPLDATIVRLPYTTGAWTSYDIDVSAAVAAAVPPADLPDPSVGLTFVKMAAGATGGGECNVYFDDLLITAATPISPGEEFVDRNTLLPQFETPTFRLFPAQEMGTSKHIMDFDFGITSPGQYRTHDDGIDGIADVHSRGFPAQLNHPGSAGGVTTTEALDTNGFDCELIEVRQDPWIDIWDELLRRSLPIMGVGTSDTHYTFSASTHCTLVRAADLNREAVLKGLFEGRSAITTSSVAGPVVLSLDGSATEPYPSRYALYVSADRPSLAVELRVAAGLKSGQQLRWKRNGTTVATVPVTGQALSATGLLTGLTDAAYLRAEIRDATSKLVALTQPVMTRPVPGLPADLWFHVAEVVTPGLTGYTNQQVGGVTAAAWNSGSSSLSIALQAPAASVTHLELASPTLLIQSVLVGGAAVPAVANAAAFDATSGSAWFEASPGRYRAKVVHASSLASVDVAFGSNIDVTPPTAPTPLVADPVSPIRVDLSWPAAFDERGVVSYRIERDGLPLLSVPGASLAYTDNAVVPATGYTYTVQAVDGAGNVSTASNTANVTTPAALLYEPFETGNLSQWPTVVGMTVQSATVFAGSFAARAATTSAAVYARRALAPANQEVAIRCRMRLANKGAQSVTLFRAMSSTTAGIVNCQLSATGKLAVRNEVTATTTVSSTTIGTGVWYLIELRVKVNGANGRIDTSIDGTPVSALSFDLNLGTAPVSHLQLGEASGGRTYDLYLDDVIVLATGVPASDTTAPTAPGNLTALVTAPNEAVLAWQASQDAVGVVAYDVVRDGNSLVSVGGSSLSYADRTLTAGSSPTYEVKARDQAGNVSAASNQVQVTTPTPALYDDFESGTLAAWPVAVGLAVQSTTAYAGTSALALTGTNGATYGRRPLGSPATEARVRLRFRYDTKDTQSLNVVKLLRTSTAGIAGLYVTATGRLALRNDITATNLTSTAQLVAGTWHHLDLRLVVNGITGITEVALDGVPVAALSVTANFGTGPVTHLQVGEPVVGRVYQAFVDDVWLA